MNDSLEVATQRV